MPTFQETPVRKWLLYLLLGVAVLGGSISVALLVALREPAFAVDEVLANYREGGDYGDGMSIRYPLDQTLFPPEIAPPTFRWEDRSGGSDAWVVTITFQDDQGRLSFPCVQREWTPPDESWEAIKRRSLGRPATVTILGVNRLAPSRILSAASISISTSEDEVGAPIFYRDVNLPFIDAVKDPSHICWRFGTISSNEPPPIVLDKLPVCGNCHSFSADGAVLGMDVDYANDKGSYMVDAVSEEMIVDKSKIITWSDYRREDGELTFGLLSQVSPDGRYIVSTLKDRSVFVPRPGLAFSQLFFPIKGILVVYDRKTKSFHPLPGADDKRFVQSNPTWSPDGKYLLFARSKAHRLKNLRKRETPLLDEEACAEFLKEGKTFLFDLYRIPFNNGKGGKAEPLLGASHNGMSNYFPKYSPDGKWIVFCKAKSFMLLQPDSELYIIPAEGGEARRLRCNTHRMNSWHSFSPNGRWLVFSSKAFSPYTQLFLTHIDDEGRSTPPVLLRQFTAPDRAANIPEFVNTRPDAIKRIRQRFVDDASYLRAGLLNAQHDYHEAAVRDLQKALQLNPTNVDALVALGGSLIRQGKTEQSKRYLTRAIELEPGNQHAHERLGNVLAEEGRFEEAASCFREALRIDPGLAPAHFRLGVLLMDLGALDEARLHLAQAVRLDPDDPKALCCLAVLLSAEGELDQAVAHFRRALQLDPNLLVALIELASIRATSDKAGLRDGQEAIELATRACRLTGYQDPAPLAALAQAYAVMERFRDAESTAERAIRAAEAAGNERMANAMRQALESYRQHQPFRPNPP